MADYNLPIDTADSEITIMIEAALDWVDENTTLNIDRKAELPNNVKLFVVKFCDLMTQTVGVSSESIGGMSQSFSTRGTAALLADLAYQLFGSAYKGRNRFITAQSRWK
jgi:hypothetical protein